MSYKFGFIGDSHSNGYFSTDRSVENWQGNNYAKIYSDINDTYCYSYAMPGAPFSKYAQWTKILLDKHPDITHLFIQSTYWDRWSMVCNLTYEYEEIDLNHFTHRAVCENKFVGYSDYHTVFDGITEWAEKPGVSTLENPSFHTHNPRDIRDVNDMTGDQYKKIRFWHEQLSHLTYFSYLKELKCIDSILQDYNIQGIVWFINDDVERPRSFDAFGSFKKLQMINYSACNFLTDQMGINPEEYMIDEEHFDLEFHTAIAKDFIPYLLSVDKQKE